MKFKKHEVVIVTYSRRSKPYLARVEEDFDDEVNEWFPLTLLENSYSNDTARKGLCKLIRHEDKQNE